MTDTSYTARQHMTFSKALKAGLFTVEYCFGCGTEQRKLYTQLEGTYAGYRYCRSCAQIALMEQYF